jgi:hypothetical protein
MTPQQDEARRLTPRQLAKMIDQCKRFIFSAKKVDKSREFLTLAAFYLLAEVVNTSNN